MRAVDELAGDQHGLCLSGLRKHLDPVLMIFIQSAGIFAANFFKEESALQRFFGQQVTATLSGCNNPAMVGT